MKWNAVHQQGQQLVWRIGFDRPRGVDHFTLAPEHQLCLRLAQGTHTQLGNELCVVGDGSDPKGLQLIWARSTPSGMRKRAKLAATFTAPSTEGLIVAFTPTSAGFRYTTVRWQVMTSIGVARSRCTLGQGVRCRRLMPIPAGRLRLTTPKLVGCVASGPEWVFDRKTKVKEVALTFDDGPSPEPPAIDFVRRLHQLKAVGTFFEIGDQISTYDPGGKAERLMLQDGDMIGDHTWTHPDMTGLSQSAQRAQIRSTAAAIRRATGGFSPCLFRAPYGDVDNELLGLVRSLGMTTIQWDVDPSDWSLPGTAVIVSRVVDGAHPGAIIIQHFGGGPRYETYDALPAEVHDLRARGYKFVTVTQLLGYKLRYR